MRRITHAVVCLGVLALLLGVGCEKEGPSKLDELVSAAQKPSERPPSEPPPPKKHSEMPPLSVDNLGAYLGGERAKPSTKKGLKKLKEIVSRLPIDKKEVILVANNKANTEDVVRTVWELGEAGAPTILIKTEGRHGLPTELRVTPESVISKPPGCSVAVAVTDKLDTGVWHIKGGTGSKHRPGFGGPDMSNTEGSITKRLARCDSKVAFFGGSFKHPWLHVYSLGALIKKADENKKIETIVLLADEPVAGRKVKLRGS